ncbi:transcription elongation factor spt4 [Coniothyrium glycines]
MARKGTATVKTPNRKDKYKTVDSDSNTVTSSSSGSGSGNGSGSGSGSGSVSGSGSGSEQHSASPRARSRKTALKPLRAPDWDQENVDPDGAREQLAQDDASTTATTTATATATATTAPCSKRPQEPHQPRQASATVRQGRPLKLAHTAAPALSLPPHQHDRTPARDTTKPPPAASSPRRRPPAQPRKRAPPAPRPNAAVGSHPASPTEPRQPTPQDVARQPDRSPEGPMAQQNTIPGGAYVPPNQQRNLRACMVCSIVRTQHQFQTSGCPNCEDVLELIGNPDQVNDCTSQVFEGLITLADPKKSWVARYQRIEDYVPGVYATQVEGMLPEDVIAAVENAGITYIPRDGSEQEMLPKD